MPNFTYVQPSGKDPGYLNLEVGTANVALANTVFESWGLGEGVFSDGLLRKPVGLTLLASLVNPAGAIESEGKRDITPLAAMHFTAIKHWGLPIELVVVSKMGLSPNLEKYVGENQSADFARKALLALLVKTMLGARDAWGTSSYGDEAKVDFQSVLRDRPRQDVINFLITLGLVSKQPGATGETKVRHMGTMEEISGALLSMNQAQIPAIPPTWDRRLPKGIR